ncbi:hypothetical protein [Streptomyces sp. MST-110588]|uniref:hypothetical protein n=1 Tax=Streptomyces sp. MST-110588 TaxID=2833628 RepID=UPI001F5C98F0|nr:hypothetical protein [Streptomyces sp. MST-110588]UNO41230.1 hypothetical protein KGS77_18690 [Streptomyces sp. MST-110588]
MQRRPFPPGVPAAVTVAAVALAAATLTACSGGSTTGGGAQDTKSGDSTASAQAAEPGKYQTLPDACTSPSKSTLRGMLPGDGTGGSPDADKAYEGQADVTYDTNRRVGCRWKRETPQGSRHLSIDFQRVVSYDAAVSDDDKAQELYGKKELAAEIPSASATPSAPASGSKPKAGDGGNSGNDGQAGGQDGTGAGDGGDNGGQDGKDGGKGADSKDKDKDKGAGGASGASTAPRVLDGLGDAAFLNDKLFTGDSGVHRDVTVVFRSSNVIVTVVYDQWSSDKTRLPDSQDLQDKAQSLAQELAEHISE